MTEPATQSGIVGPPPSVYMPQVNQLYLEKHLQDDWIDALSIFKARVPSMDVNTLYPRTELRIGDGLQYRAVTALFKGGMSTPRECVMWVNGGIGNFYKVERVEIMLYVAVRAWAWLYHNEKRDLSPDVMELCKRVGTAPQNYPHPMQRWILLYMFVDDWREIPVAKAFEDRPKCGICPQAVATGHRRHDAHDGCIAYAVHHIYPDLRERRAAAERLAKQAEGMDHD